MQNERREVAADIIQRSVSERARRLITAAGRQSFVWSVSRPTRCEVVENGCNWNIVFNGPADIRAIAEPAVQDAKSRYNLKPRASRHQSNIL
jgi:hypothetical protein